MGYFALFATPKEPPATACRNSAAGCGLETMRSCMQGAWYAPMGAHVKQNCALGRPESVLGGNDPCEPPRAARGQRPHNYGCRTGTQAKRQEGKARKGRGGAGPPDRQTDRCTSRPLHVGGTQPLPSAKFVSSVSCRVALLCFCRGVLFVITLAERYRSVGRHAKVANRQTVHFVGRHAKVAVLFITVIPPLWIS